MSPLIIIVASTFLVVAVITLMLLSLLTSKKSIVEVRLEELRGIKTSDVDIIDTTKQEEAAWQKTATAVGASVPVSQKTLFKYRRQLIHAGFRSPSAPGIFIGSKLILGTAFFFVLFLYTLSVRHNMSLALLLGVLTFVAGFILPNVWLTERVKKRQTEIFHTLPDVLDLMTVCVEAGLGLDAAIIKISEEKQFAKKILAAEFRTVSQEIRAGKPRVDALRDLGERTGVDDIKALVALLIQTEKLGASLARSLRVHSDSLRTKRRQIAEEAAAKTPIKLIFPLAFFIFPSLLVVLLGPAIIKIYDTLLGVVH
jgi:tight adherence protein C